MIIPRPTYLKQLISAKGNNLIKIVTGIRRCGKSFLLFEIFHAYLNSIGVDNRHIIEVSLDDRVNAELRHPDKLLQFIKSKINDERDFYVLLDEIQMVDDFVGVLNSLLHVKNVDVYVTGSNSKFLSKDVVTEFRGRGQDIHMYPLSFSEYYNAVGGETVLCWRDYSTYGGLPQAALMADDKSKRDYLTHLADTLYIADVMERHKVKNQYEMEELLQILASSIGSACNPTKLANTFKSVKKVSISSSTISKYLSYFCDAFIMEKAMRYNIKGKRYINTLTKYYFTDIGLRNALLGFRQIEPSHIMENIIYNELLIQGYMVDVGVVEQIEKDKEGKSVRKSFEVDFVANSHGQKYYIQSAYAIPDNVKLRQETNSFRHIDDTFKRIVILNDYIHPYRDEDGILFVGLFDFLLNPAVLNK